MSASVTIMLSSDYNHFEVTKGSDQNLSDAEIDAMRKDVQRLALNAVDQYRKFKQYEIDRSLRTQEREQQKRDAERILAKEEENRTLKEMAILKAYQDRNWEEYINRRYDFDDETDEQVYIVAS